MSDHKSLAAVLKGNKNSTTYSSRLTRWVDRLLPFEFEKLSMHREQQSDSQIICLDTHHKYTEKV